MGTINTTKKKHRHETITMMRNMLLAIVLVLSVHAAIPRCTTCAKDLDACQPCFRRWRADQARYQQSAYYNPHDKRNQYDNPLYTIRPGDSQHTQQGTGGDDYFRYGHYNGHQNDWNGTHRRLLGNQLRSKTKCTKVSELLRCHEMF